LSFLRVHWLMQGSIPLGTIDQPAYEAKMSELLIREEVGIGLVSPA
jgi:hypothetical protein